MPHDMTLTWSYDMSKALLDSLLTSRDAGMHTENGWKYQAFANATAEVRKVAGKHQAALVNFFKVRPKYNVLKKDWQLFDNFAKQPNFKVNPQTGCVVGDRADLEVYLAQHPRARKFACKPLEFSRELYDLFGDANASRQSQSPIRQSPKQPVNESTSPALDESIEGEPTLSSLGHRPVMSPEEIMPSFPFRHQGFEQREQPQEQQRPTVLAQDSVASERRLGVASSRDGPLSARPPMGGDSLFSRSGLHRDTPPEEHSDLDETIPALGQTLAIIASQLMKTRRNERALERACALVWGGFEDISPEDKMTALTLMIDQPNKAFVLMSAPEGVRRYIIESWIGQGERDKAERRSSTRKRPRDELESSESD